MKKYKPKYAQKEKIEDQIPLQTQSSVVTKKKKVFIQKPDHHEEECCLVCSEIIKVKEQIWNCRCCYKYMHLRCIKKWILNCNKNQKKKELLQWSCPQCKFEYQEKMPQYYCFCGKYRSPQYENDIFPHSCGRRCEKKRGYFCPHPCPQLCHPGKCKPCNLQGIQITCSCGKTKSIIKCSQQRETFQCEKKCQKQLNCKKHLCKKNCHAGPCGACTIKHMATCFCSKNQDIIDCRLQSYSCGQICGKLLQCGHHKCQRKCHQGDCLSCKKKPQLVKSCPCGQYSLQMLTGSSDFRQSCLDPIPLCGMPCKKKLSCSHLCMKSCHQGECSKCKVSVVQLCVCGASTRKAQCWQISEGVKFRCEKVCKHKKNCNQHNCNIVCCEYRTSQVPSDHPCNLICQKLLSCQKHTCGLACHTGNCDKCAVLYSQPQPCPCGRTSLRPPVACGTIVPQCQNYCQKVLQCGHVCKLTCHYGDCRCSQKILIKCQCGLKDIETLCGKKALCTQKCKKILPCGHICQIQCHFGQCSKAIDGCGKICNKKRQNCQHICLQRCHPNKLCTRKPCQTEVLIKCECGNRQKLVACGSTDKLIEKHITCNKTCQNLKRFSILYKQKQIYYPNSLLIFGLRHMTYLQKLENNVQSFINSERNSLHVDFKFGNDMNIKIQMHTLFEKHYHLEAYYYPNRKAPFFTLNHTKFTMIPKPNLSNYIKLVAKGQIKKNNLPFQASVKLPPLPKQKIDLMQVFLKQYLHNYYSQRKDKNHYFHFWLKQNAETAYQLLKQRYGGITISLEINTIEAQIQQPIDISEIVQQQIENKVPTQQIEKKQIKSENQILEKDKKINIQNIQSVKQSIKQQKIQILPPKTNLKKPQIFKKKVYPPSEQFVQSIYNLDDDQLDDLQVNWTQYLEQIWSKQLGIQASQWRIRASIIIYGLFGIGYQYIKNNLLELLKWYQQEKVKGRRMLSIRNIQTKKIQSFLYQNDIIISKNQPQMTTYAILLGLNPNQITPQLLQTEQVKKALELQQAYNKNQYNQYFQLLNRADYVMACALVKDLKQMRQKILSKTKKGFKQKELCEKLFFSDMTQFKEFLDQQGYELKRITKKSNKDNSSDEQDFDYTSKLELKSETTEEKLQQKNQNVQKFDKISHNFSQDQRLLEKRDIKYALESPKEVYLQRYCLKSYFAFGDHRFGGEVYVSKVIKSLKKK